VDVASGKGGSTWNSAGPGGSFEQPNPSSINGTSMGIFAT
jgi:hypothetical protein